MFDLKRVVLTFSLVVMILVMISYVFRKKEEGFDGGVQPVRVDDKLDMNRVVRKTVERRIPKVIHKVYICHDGTLDMKSQPQHIIEAHNTWKELNPGYVIKYYSRIDCENYLKAHFSEEYLTVFKSLKPYSYKCDFFRYCVVYNEGGVYTDWKMVCLKPLDEYITDTSTFVGEWDYKIPDLINGFFASCPKNTLLKLAIDLCVFNTKTRNYNLKNFLYPTGPGCFGVAFSKYMKTHNVDTNTIFYKDYHLQKPDDDIQIGIHNNNHIWMNGENVIMVKCEKCNKSQNWKDGNNYAQMWYNRDVYE